MNRKAYVNLYDQKVGELFETDEGYVFAYAADYAAQRTVQPVSLTLPVMDTPYRSTILFPFFDGLIPEGWLLDIAERDWKLQANDRFGLLLACCQDCIGAVSIIPVSPQ